MEIIRKILRWLGIGRWWKSCIERQSNPIRGDIFPSPSVDCLILTLKKWRMLKARRNNEGTEWRIEAESVTDALWMFYLLEDTIEELANSHIHSQCDIGNGIYLSARVGNAHQVILTTMTDNPDDIAEICFVDCGKRVNTLRFAKNI